MSITHEILILLRRYVACAETIVGDLQSELGSTNLLLGVNSGTVPRSGRCKSFGGGEYYFHGVGCRVIAAEIEINFDFGPEGTVPGADPWKLYDFAAAHAEAYPWLPEREVFGDAINQLVETRILRRLGQMPSPQLLCEL